MLSSAMTRSLDFLVALFTDFSPMFGGSPDDAGGDGSTAERRASRSQDNNWLLSRIQATFSPSSSRRRCNSDASITHILCLSDWTVSNLVRFVNPCVCVLFCFVLARPPASRPRVPVAQVRTEEPVRRRQIQWIRI